MATLIQTEGNGGLVGGPNRSGKTALALEYAAETGFRYIRAGAIAAKIDPSQPSRAQVAAANLFIQQLNDCVAARESIVVESTLSGLTMRKGGHHVPEADLRRRFPGAVASFWGVYQKMADNWVLLDKGETAIQDVAGGSRDQMTIREPTRYANFLKLVERSDNG